MSDDAKFAIVLTVVTVAIITGMILLFSALDGEDGSSFKQDCERRGGEHADITYDDLCVRDGLIIDVE